MGRPAGSAGRFNDALHELVPDSDAIQGGAKVLKLRFQLSHRLKAVVAWAILTPLKGRDRHRVPCGNWERIVIVS